MQNYKKYFLFLHSQSDEGASSLKTGMKADPAMALMSSRLDEKFSAMVLVPSMTLVTEMLRRPLAITWMSSGKI